MGPFSHVLLVPPEKIGTKMRYSYINTTSDTLVL